MADSQSTASTIEVPEPPVVARQHSGPWSPVRRAPVHSCYTDCPSRLNPGFAAPQPPPVAPQSQDDDDVTVDEPVNDAPIVTAPADEVAEKSSSVLSWNYLDDSSSSSSGTRRREGSDDSTSDAAESHDYLRVFLAGKQTACADNNEAFADEREFGVSAAQSCERDATESGSVSGTSNCEYGSISYDTYSSGTPEYSDESSSTSGCGDYSSDSYSEASTPCLSEGGGNDTRSSSYCDSRTGSETSSASYDEESTTADDYSDLPSLSQPLSSQDSRTKTTAPCDGACYPSSCHDPVPKNNNGCDEAPRPARRRRRAAALPEISRQNSNMQIDCAPREGELSSGLSRFGSGFADDAVSTALDEDEERSVALGWIVSEFDTTPPAVVSTPTVETVLSPPPRREQPSRAVKRKRDALEDQQTSALDATKAPASKRARRAPPQKATATSRPSVVKQPPAAAVVSPTDVFTRVLRPRVTAPAPATSTIATHVMRSVKPSVAVAAVAGMLRRSSRIAARREEVSCV